MNFKQMAADIGLDEDEFLELAETFIESSNDDLRALKAAIECGNVDGVVSASHSVKGSALNFGFLEISEVAKRIETRARQGVLDGAVEAAADLSKRVGKLAEAFGAQLKSHA